jgi:hypothetical protein
VEDCGGVVFIARPTKRGSQNHTAAPKGSSTKKKMMPQASSFSPPRHFFMAARIAPANQLTSITAVTMPTKYLIPHLKPLIATPVSKPFDL